MNPLDQSLDRRKFLKISAAASGGLVLGFTWGSCTSPQEVEVLTMPSEWYDMNAFLKIGDNGVVTIMSPNPEIGQNVKTSMPMIIAEELDVAWKNVVVKQAPLNTDTFTRQVAGGSQSIRQGWESLRTTGATARQMLVNAAAQQWGVEASSCTTSEGMIKNGNGESISYGEVASLAATLEVPESLELKDHKDYKIIGTPTGNVDINDIITGKPLFGMDTKEEAMTYAAVLRPPSFGMKLEDYDDTAAKSVTGVTDVIKFGDKIAVLGASNWSVLKAKDALVANWKEDTKLESTTDHDAEMLRLLDTPAAEPKRKDGNPEEAFASADKVIEKVYEAPFLPHNCLEPMNFYADVRADKVYLNGPIQTPEWTRRRIAELLEREESEIHIDMTRMGGGFGRRLYGDFALEAAEISKIAEQPIQLTYTREDDMTAGIYRPASKYKFRAALKDNKLVGYHLTGVGINMRNATRENNFPAGAIDNYLVESHNLESNITTGAWRAPITNFLAYAEQSFFDELAEEMGIDAVQLRLDLFERAKNDPVGEPGYDAEKSIGVIKLAAEKSNWGKVNEGIHQGFSTYYSHNTYVAEVADMVMDEGSPKVTKVTCAIDCGIVINPKGAINQVEGGIVDGIGHAMYGDFSFVKGKPQADNFNKYRLIRMSEAPDAIDVHFVESTNDPTGLGEPTLPPAGGAISNAIYSATGKRLYKQPFVKETDLLG